MGTGPTNGALRHVRGLAGRDAAGPADADLLAAFVRDRDPAALAALVERHGPLVWAVCRRQLAHHDAEDAFQATFLVLARKAGTVRHPAAVADWLYGVAHRTALRARAAAARRAARERPAADAPEPAAADRAPEPDVGPLVDRELSRLPDKYRRLIVLCDLEGRTRKETAERLGCPEGTVAGRLARARALLAARLARHGLAVTTATVAGLGTAGARVPAGLVSATVEAVGPVTPATVSARAVALANGVTRAMWMHQMRVPAVVLAAAVLAVGAASLYPAAAGDPAGPGPDRKAPPAGKDAPAGKAPEPRGKEPARPVPADDLDPKALRDPGNRFDVEVVGRTDGPVSGTELYFYDSDLATAAVHAGLVKPKEKAVITVTVVKCPKAGAGSTANGVTSTPWADARPTDTALVLQRRPDKPRPPAGKPEPPAPVGLTAGPAELRDLLPGGHGWKWRIRAADPYREVSARLVRYARSPAGKLTRHVITDDSYVSGQARSADEVLIACGDKDGLVGYAIALPVGRGKRVTALANVKWADYQPTGTGAGGVPPRIGDGYVLLVRPVAGKPVDPKGELRADDLEAYIAVEVVTK